MPEPIPAHSSFVSRDSPHRLVATLALAAFLLPALPWSLADAHADAMAMACCAARHCRMPAFSTPCCSRDAASPLTPPVAVTPTTAHDTTPLAQWAAVALDLPTLALHWRVLSLEATIRGRPPDPPHLLNGVFLI
jgi:hypothetical protein